MRLIVCGGRAFAGRHQLFAVLDRIHAETPITALIHGNARGADGLADDWAAHRGVLTLTFLPAWEEHGPAAGPIRNQQMLDEGRPDLVVAFPGGSGTADMVSRAHRANVPVMTVPA